MITGTHVTDLPEDARKIAAKIQRKPYVPMGQETDGSASQFPNEVRVGDTTLAFADGVPSHDGDDDGSDNDQAGDARPSLFARLFGRKSKTTNPLTSMLPTIHSTVPPASMVPPPKPRWSIR